MPDPDWIEVVSKRSKRKLIIPRKRYEQYPQFFKIPPRRRGGRQPDAAPPVDTPAKPVDEAATDDKEAADGAQTEQRTD